MGASQEWRELRGLFEGAGRWIGLIVALIPPVFFLLLHMTVDAGSDRYPEAWLNPVLLSIAVVTSVGALILAARQRRYIGALGAVFALLYPLNWLGPGNEAFIGYVTTCTEYHECSEAQMVIEALWGVWAFFTMFALIPRPESRVGAFAAVRYLMLGLVMPFAGWSLTYPAVGIYVAGGGFIGGAAIGLGFVIAALVAGVRGTVREVRQHPKATLTRS